MLIEASKISFPAEENVSIKLFILIFNATTNFNGCSIILSFTFFWFAHSSLTDIHTKTTT